jgi:hypothetical protein
VEIVAVIVTQVEYPLSEMVLTWARSVSDLKVFRILKCLHRYYWLNSSSLKI